MKRQEGIILVKVQLPKVPTQSNFEHIFVSHIQNCFPRICQYSQNLTDKALNWILNINSSNEFTKLEMIIF